MSDAYTRQIVDQGAQAGAPAQQPDDTVVLQQSGHQPDATGSSQRSASRPWGRDLRFMLVVLAGIVVLFLAFALLIAFSPTGAGISALAVIAAPIATMVAAYYGISLALRQVADAREEDGLEPRDQTLGTCQPGSRVVDPLPIADDEERRMVERGELAIGDLHREDARVVVAESRHPDLHLAHEPLVGEAPCHHRAQGRSDGERHRDEAAGPDRESG